MEILFLNKNKKKLIKMQEKIYIDIGTDIYVDNTIIAEYSDENKANKVFNAIINEIRRGENIIDISEIERNECINNYAE